MKLNDIFNFGNAAFQGDRTVEWRRIPAGARIQRATAIVTPTAAGGTNPFAETIRFNGATGDWGATKTVVSSWVEVDFHARRTLAAVGGRNLNGAILQVDLGGAYVEINDRGALKTPSDTNFFTLAGSTQNDLPGLTATKFKLTAAAGPDVSEVVIRSAPTNVSLRFGQTPVFWTRVGELAQVETTPDFSASLQAFLGDAKVENGFYVVPLIVHSDSIARLKVEFDVEFLVEQNALPNGLSDITLPYNFDGLPTASPELITITAPAGARIVPQASRARITGVFADTRIVYNPTEIIPPEGFVMRIQPAGKVIISPDDSFAQPISLLADTAATAIDLLLEIKQNVRLQLDLREDLDGKPGETSLLPAVVEVDLDGPVGLEGERSAADRQRWISVPLDAEFQFKATAMGKPKRYWLVLQSLEGEAAWSVATVQTIGLQRLSLRAADAGLAWRDAALGGDKSLLAAFFRLRHLPKRFTMPIALEVGAVDNPVRVDLSRYQDQGRIDFALDFAELEQARQKYLSKAPTACAEVEHLANGDFETWMALGNEVTGPAATLNFGIQPGNQFAVAVAPDGSLGYALFLRPANANAADLQVFDPLCERPVESLLNQILTIPANKLLIKPDGSRLYVADRQQAQILDLQSGRALSAPFNIVNGVEEWALSPDGGRLYVIGHDHEITVIDTAELESKSAGGQMATLTMQPFDRSNGASALAASPDGRRVYALIKTSGTVTTVTLQAFDTASRQPLDQTTPLSGSANSIAVASDGQMIVVGNGSGGTISLIEAATGAISAPIPVNKTTGTFTPFPVALAVASDGKQIYVARQTDHSGTSTGHVVLMDLVRRVIVKEFPLKFAPGSLVLAPQGNRLYVTRGTIAAETNELTFFKIGEDRPTEWNLTSGSVTLECLDAPFNRVARLEGISPGTGEPRPAALSQVTPVTGSCIYDFSFHAAATDVGAVAEVFWLGDPCGLLQASDPVPINVAPNSIGATNVDSNNLAVIGNFTGTLDSPQPLTLHRMRLTAPAQATQAEVRFSAPGGVAVNLDRVSLMGTTDAVANGDFQLLPSGQIEGWVFPAGATPGLSVISAADGLLLRNSGSSVVEMSQTAQAKGARAFNLEFHGRVSALGGITGGAAQRPRLEARWLKADGSAAASPAIVELQADTATAAIAQGQSPPEASHVEMRLILPPGTALTIQRISLKFPPTFSVPVTFVAQAPGELTITGLQISFEQDEPMPPPIPERGLCPPTPLDVSPGAGKSSHGHCGCCGAEKEMVGTCAVTTDAERPALIGVCADCDAEMISFAGASVANAPRLSLSGMRARQPVVIHADAVQVGAVKAKVERITDAPSESSRNHLEASLGVVSSPTANSTSLTKIKGVTKRRAAELAKIGITSAEALATASPRKIGKVKGFSPEIAKTLIALAKTRIKGKRSN